MTDYPVSGKVLEENPEEGSRELFKETFEPDGTEGILAILVFILGFIFVRWILFNWRGWSVTFFTACYLGVTALYFRKRRVIIPGEGWFWLAITMLTGISYSLWNNYGLEPWRGMLLFVTAIYWVLCATGLQLLGKTSNFIFIDFLNGLLNIPFRNFENVFKSISLLGKKKQAKAGTFFAVLLGIALALIIFVMVLPLLLAADSGGFTRIADKIFHFLRFLQGDVIDLIFHLVISIPTAAYIYGLMTGSVYKRGCLNLRKEDLDRHVRSLRLLPPATVYTLLGLVCCLYIVFIACQLPYFFSAFIGERPEGWLVYSEYARRGFFELCAIAAINLFLITGANLFSQKQRWQSAPLAVLNVLLALLTLLLISTACSKMALYIEAYGLTVRRLLPSVFLVFLAIVLGGVIALQKRQFSLLRLAAITGATILCLLCLLNPDGIVARYNAERYLQGTLSNFDVQILYLGGPAGIDPALKVLSQTGDPLLQEQLNAYLESQRQWSEHYSGTPWDTLENRKARQITLKGTAAPWAYTGYAYPD